MFFSEEVPENRRRSYCYFAAALLLCLGSQQFIVPVKTALFMGTVGAAYEPLAKTLVLPIMCPVLLVYSLLVTAIRGPKLLSCVVCTIYGGLYLFILLAMAVSSEQSPSLAWILFYTTETKGLVLMPMIWSVISDVTPPSMARKAYPLIFFIVQVGGILGSLVALSASDIGGEVGLVLLQVVAFAAIALCLWRACSLIVDGDDEETPLASRLHRLESAGPSVQGGRGEMRALPEKEDHADVASYLQARWHKASEGLYFLGTRPFVFMLYWVSAAGFVPMMIVEYQNNVLGTQIYQTREEQIAYFGRVNVATNLGTALFTLIVTRGLIELTTVGNSLLVFPVVALGCTLFLCIGFSLTAAAWSVVIMGIVCSGLNSPCKEMLYVRTSRDIRYKAKGWSEMFGYQLMKLLGAQLNMLANAERDVCHPHCFNTVYTALVGTVWCTAWFFIAWRVGHQHRQLEHEDALLA